MKKAIFILIAALLSAPSFILGVSAYAASVSADVDTRVYDQAGNVLYYHSESGIVYSDKGVVTDATSTPLNYVAASGATYNGKNEKLDIIRSAGKNYLLSGGYKVTSIGVDDKLCLINYVFKGEKIPQLTYVKIEPKGLNIWNILFPLTVVFGDKYNFYDLFGHKLEGGRFESTMNLWFLGPLGYMLDTTCIKVYDVSSIREFLKEFRYEDIGSGNAVDGSGTPLKSAGGQHIYVAANGQLTDVLGCPVIGTDTRPVMFEDGVYRGFKTQRALTAEGGVLQEVQTSFDYWTDELRLYFVYMKGGTVECPAEGMYEGGEIVFYFLNGEKATKELTAPSEISPWDREQNYDDPSGWRQFWDKVGAFIVKYGLIVLGVLAVLVVVGFLLKKAWGW